MSLTLEQFVMEGAEKDHGFAPNARYNRYGDCIEFVFEQETFYAERIDDLLTLYIGESSGKPVGGVLKGVSKFIKKAATRLPGLAVYAKAGSIELDYLFALKMLITDSCTLPSARETYGHLSEEAGKNRIQAYFDPINHLQEPVGCY